VKSFDILEEKKIEVNLDL